MFAILSPAKTLDMTAATPAKFKTSTPRLSGRTKTLANTLDTVDRFNLLDAGRCVCFCSRAPYSNAILGVGRSFLFPGYHFPRRLQNIPHI